MAWTLREEPARGLDVAREERLDRLFDPYCGHAAVLTAGVGICTVSALWCTLDGLCCRGIGRIALWCALLHRTFRTSGAVGQRFESSVARHRNHWGLFTLLGATRTKTRTKIRTNGPRPREADAPMVLGRRPMLPTALPAWMLTRYLRGPSV
jgi:hypothetical protein